MQQYGGISNKQCLTKEAKQQRVHTVRSAVINEKNTGI